MLYIKTMLEAHQIHLSVSGILILMLVLGIVFSSIASPLSTLGYFLVLGSLVGFAIMTPIAYVPWYNRGYIYPVTPVVPFVEFPLVERGRERRFEGFRRR
jgi:hypothetical protein